MTRPLMARAGRLGAALTLALAALGTSCAVQAADPAKGRQLYSAKCAVCHGMSGRAVMPGAPNFSQGERLMRPDLALLASIRSGKNAMPAFQGILPDRDIMDVIAFIRTLH